MDSNLMRSLVIGAFGMHGLGMLGAAGYMPFDARRSFVGPSWLIGSDRLDLLIAIPVWALAGVGYIAAAWGYWNDVSWWPWAAWLGSILTLVAVGLWAGRVPPGVYVGGLLAVATVAYLAML